MTASTGVFLINFHRGIYEHLWSEHRFSVSAVSLKLCDSARAKLGAKVSVFSLLELLSATALSDKPNILHGYLSMYDQIKYRLSREQRNEIVEELLADDPLAIETIFRSLIELSDKALAGCRLFYPDAGFYKIWDYGDFPGLWLCFGPFQLHLDFTIVRDRLSACSDYSDQSLARLKNGIPISDYLELSQNLRLSLERNLCVAKAGNTVFLHPRMVFSLPNNAENKTGFEESSAMMLESLWDAEPRLIGQVPELSVWLEVLEKLHSSNRAAGFENTACTELRKAHEYLTGAFNARREYEIELRKRKSAGLKEAD